MGQACRVAGVVALLMLTVSCGGSDRTPQTDSLVVAVPLSWPLQPWLPEFERPFETALAAFESARGRDVEVRVARVPDVAAGAFGFLLEEDPPDLIVVPAAGLPALVERGLLTSLESWVDERDELVADLPSAVLDRFRVEGALCALPLGPQDELGALGFAVTAAAVEAGRAEEARDLLAEIRRHAPLRDLPDLAVLDARVVPADPDLPGASAMLDLTLTNIGDVTAPATVVAVQLDDGPPFTTVDVPSLAPDEDHSVRLLLPAATNEVHRVVARIDALEAIDELQEGNNGTVDAWQATPSSSGKPAAVKVVGGPWVLDAAAFRANSRDSGPKVAFDGTNYLVVWARQPKLSASLYDLQLRAARITPAGVILDPAPSRPVSGFTSPYLAFDVAFGGGVYLVVWEDASYVFPNAGPLNPASTIDATRLSTSGQILPSGTTSGYVTVHGKAGPGPGGPVHTDPAVYFDGQDFMVFGRASRINGGVTQDAADGGVWVRMVKPSGYLGANRVRVVGLNASQLLSGGLAAAFGSTRGYLAYGGFTPTERFVACTELPVPFSGAQGIAHILKSHTPPGKTWFSDPAAAAADDTNFGFAWTVVDHAQDPVRPQVQSDLLTHPPGTPNQPGAFLNACCDSRPAIGYDGKNYLMAWERQKGCRSYVALCRRSPQGALGDAMRLNDPKVDLISHVDIACGKTNAMVVYANYRPGPAVGAAEGHYEVGFFLVDLSP